MLRTFAPPRAIPSFELKLLVSDPREINCIQLHLRFFGGLLHMAPLLLGPFFPEQRITRSAARADGPKTLVLHSQIGRW